MEQQEDARLESLKKLFLKYIEVNVRVNESIAMVSVSQRITNTYPTVKREIFARLKFRIFHNLIQFAKVYSQICNINTQTRTINMQITNLIPRNVCLIAKSRNILPQNFPAIRYPVVPSLPYNTLLYPIVPYPTILHPTLPYCNLSNILYPTLPYGILTYHIIAYLHRIPTQKVHL